MSKNDKKAAMAIAMIQTFAEMALKMRKEGLLRILKILDAEYRGTMNRKEIMQIEAFLDMVYTRMVESKYKITPLFVLLFASNFAIEYMYLTRGKRKVAWIALNSFVMEHPVYKRLHKQENPNLVPFEQSDEFVAYIVDELQKI